jgi:hypothetical protein
MRSSRYRSNSPVQARLRRATPTLRTTSTTTSVRKKL